MLLFYIGLYSSERDDLLELDDSTLTDDSLNFSNNNQNTEGNYCNYHNNWTCLEKKYTICVV